MVGHYFHGSPYFSNLSANIVQVLAPVSGSVVTAAVKPTPDEPLPVVAIARGAVWRTYRNICDLAVDGSPINRTLMSLKTGK